MLKLDVMVARDWGFAMAAMDDEKGEGCEGTKREGLRKSECSQEQRWSAECVLGGKSKRVGLKPID